jgi:hypothetical protein
MKRMTIPLLLLVGTVALIVLTGPSLLSPKSTGAEAPKARTQWEYAHLILGDTAADVHWQAGKTTLSSSGDVNKPDPTRSIDELYQKLGGKEPKPTLGVILDQIGQDGWEMVSYVRPPGVQTWMFKRARR